MNIRDLMNRRRARAIVSILAAGSALVFVLTTSIEPSGRTLPPPSGTATTEPGPPTTPPDYSRIALEAVPGETTVPPPLAVGRSVLRGTVSGPDGPVPGAIVRADRIVAGGTQRSDVVTGADGTFTLGSVPGGRFRVRAFLAPTLAMTDAEVFFLTDGETKDLRLQVDQFVGAIVRASTTPSAPIVGQAVNLAVRIADRTVDADGIVRETPRPGETVRVAAAGWTSLDQRPTTTTSSTLIPEPDRQPADEGQPVMVTDGNGVAVFHFRCDRVTAVSASATVGADGQVYPLDVPPCAPVPTTTTAAPTTTTEGPGSSTTSAPEG